MPIEHERSEGEAEGERDGSRRQRPRPNAPWPLIRAVSEQRLRVAGIIPRGRRRGVAGGRRGSRRAPAPRPRAQDTAAVPPRATPASRGTLLPREDPVLPEQCRHLGRAAAEFDEGFEGIAAAAAAEDRIQEALRGRRIEHAALLESGEGVRREHFGPLVAVIAGGVTAGEDVAEAVGEAVPLRDRHDRDFAAYLAEN